MPGGSASDYLHAALPDIAQPGYQNRLGKQIATVKSLQAGSPCQRFLAYRSSNDSIVVALAAEPLQYEKPLQAIPFFLEVVMSYSCRLGPTTVRSRHDSPDLYSPLSPVLNS